MKADLNLIGWESVQWIHLAQDRDRWRAVVNAVMNLRVLAPRSYLRCGQTGKISAMSYFVHFVGSIHIILPFHRPMFFKHKDYCFQN
jgi:hypothetical protein